MNVGILVIEFTRLEAAHLTDLLEQFVELLQESATAPLRDPAVSRLVPDAYPDDAAASDEFRGITQADLLGRRVADARVVLDTLTVDGELIRVTDVTGGVPAAAAESITVQLASTQIAAWLRSLAALRLVLASRLGVSDDDDHAEGDPRFGIYDWLGYRLDGFLGALDAGSDGDTLR